MKTFFENILKNFLAALNEELNAVVLYL